MTSEKRIHIFFGNMGELLRPSVVLSQSHWSFSHLEWHLLRSKTYATKVLEFALPWTLQRPACLTSLSCLPYSPPLPSQKHVPNNLHTPLLYGRSNHVRPHATSVSPFLGFR